MILGEDAPHCYSSTGVPVRKNEKMSRTDRTNPRVSTQLSSHRGNEQTNKLPGEMKLVGLSFLQPEPFDVLGDVLSTSTAWGSWHRADMLHRILEGHAVRAQNVFGDAREGREVRGAFFPSGAERKGSAGIARTGRPTQSAPRPWRCSFPVATHSTSMEKYVAT